MHHIGTIGMHPYNAVGPLLVLLLTCLLLVLACAAGDGALVYLDFGMMSEAPAYARFAIMAHVVHLVNR
jgi:predicted unusual protein kinase regulating ubiquinone biosynthesis (AarF/ABC1/UbiB family)